MSVSATTASETALPELVGRYRVDAILGQGAMGVVYKGHDPHIDRPVALKLIRADLLGTRDSAEYIARFKREAQAAGRCMHPNIVAVYDFAEHEGNPFIAMELVEGETLLDRFERGERFSVAEALDIIQQVLGALECAHGVGITHRDIKPANIILPTGRKVKVADFGVSRIESSSLTRDGSTIGSPSYMSPEQCRGDEVDGRADLFSAGAVLFEMLASEKPFPGKTYTEVIYKVLNAAPAHIVGRVPGVTPALDEAVLRALAKEREERYATAAEMAAALRLAASVPAAAEPPAEAEGEDSPDHTIIMASPAATAARPAAARTATAQTGAAAAPAATAARPAAPTVASGATAGTAGTAGGGPAATLDPAMVAAVERTLLRHIGPIAKVVVERSARQAADIDTLCRTLSASIPDGKEREEFLREAALARKEQRAKRGTVDPSSSSLGARLRLNDDDLAAIERALTLHIGPIAKVVIKRELKQSRTVADLCDRLGTHIQADKDRAQFRTAVNHWLR